jgi:hypothetical protein
VNTRFLLLAVLVVTGTLLAARGLAGPLTFPVRVNSPMNLEGIFALALLALTITGGKPLTLRKWTPAPDLVWMAILAVLVLAAFAGALDFPFLADDYSHIWNARHADARALWAHFTVPEDDHFFRPMVYLSYWLDAHWAGISPWNWRAANLALHAVNSLLVYWLCRELGFARVGAFTGALLFGLNGSRPEAVTWVAARFDLLAVLFGLAAILAAVRGARWWAVGGWMVLAILSKESAYMVPGLIALALWYQGSRWREIGLRIAPLIGIELAALAYRLWLLGGIGGYRDAGNGAPTIFNFGLASTAKAMLPRFWAAMMFPLNWTGGLRVSTAILLALAIAALIYLGWRGVERRKFWLGVGMAAVCSLPVHQFLSIGPDLEKSRVLYFASVGLAVLWAAMFEYPEWKAAVCGIALVGFQWSALESNLGHWRQVGELAKKTCAAAAADAGGTGAVTVAGLPNVVDGVYFLHTGFPECVQFITPGIQVLTKAEGGTRTFQWDPETRTLH